MKNALKRITNNPAQSSARVVDGKLILTFPGARNPVVWQMDFSQVKASALEVHNEGEGHALVLKTPKGETVDVASFDKREDAVYALMAAAGALENAHGKIRTVQPAQAANVNVAETAQTSRRGKKWLGPVLGILLLIVLFSVWASLAPQAVLTGAEEGFGSSASAPSQQDTAGVPLSADEFLRSR